jgi:hypothetical protein
LASVIRVIVEGEDHSERARALEFNLADFAGQLPQPGDVVLLPAGEAGRESRVWEVEARYFDPGRGFDASGLLFVRVRSREATKAERAHLGLPP